MKILSYPQIFNKEFARLCRDYDCCDMFVAWCGSPHYGLPYSHLESLKRIQATIGFDLFNTHPDGIEKLMATGASVRMVKFQKGKIFHPKLYLFSNIKNSQKALIIGSNNFSANAFTANDELAILIENNELTEEIMDSISKKTMIWKSDHFSTPVQPKWLKWYRSKYNENYKRKPKTPKDIEESLNKASWIINLSWPEYYNSVIKAHKEIESFSIDDKDLGYRYVLTEFKKLFTFPIKISVFDKLDNRRMLLGESDYATMGHIGASGKAKHLFAKGRRDQKKMIVEVLNYVHGLNSNSRPVDYEFLRSLLRKLEKLGLTMKCWGRLLALCRPDLFFTVSSDFVRESFSEALNIPKASLQHADGYVSALRLIHQSLWFNSPKPISSGRERFIWENRIAYLDVIFYYT